MALNQQAVITTVQKEAGTTILALDRAVALISDTTTVTSLYSLYTSTKEIETAGYTTTSDFYKMGKSYFDNGGKYLYGVPLSDTGGNADIVAKLEELSSISDSTFSFIGVLMDSTIRVATQVTDGSTLVSYALGKSFNIIIEANDNTLITNATTDVASVNKAFYDSLTGDNSLKVGNLSVVYTSSNDDFIASGLMGIFLGNDIGSQIAKFKKPLNSVTAKNGSGNELLNSELTFLLDKNANVYTGTNERVGESFVKEGTTLKAGSYIDTSFGSIWLKENLEVNVYQLLKTRKIPMNNKGFTLLTEKIIPIFEKAINQGIIDGQANIPFNISFSSKDKTNRIIEAKYSYYESVAGQFVEQTLTIKAGV